MSVIHRFTGSQAKSTFSWEGVQPVEINADEVQGVAKHVLVGQQEGASDFIIRYFQVPAGSSTFYHAHPHEHGMLILHGTAQIQIKEAFFDLSPMDSVFISGNDLHQVKNSGEVPLGFICVIPKIEA